MKGQAMQGVGILLILIPHSINESAWVCWFTVGARVETWQKGVSIQKRLRLGAYLYGDCS